MNPGQLVNYGAGPALGSGSFLCPRANKLDDLIGFGVCRGVPKLYYPELEEAVIEALIQNSGPLLRLLKKTGAIEFGMQCFLGAKVRVYDGPDVDDENVVATINLMKLVRDAVELRSEEAGSEFLEHAITDLSILARDLEKLALYVRKQQRRQEKLRKK